MGLIAGAEEPYAPGVVRISDGGVVDFSRLADQEALSPPGRRQAVKSPPRLRLASDRDVPAEPIRLPVPRTGAAGAQALSPGTVSPSPSSSFLALVDDGITLPPDTQGAVGPNHLLTVLNSQIRAHDRSGGALRTVSLDGFLSGLFLDYAYDPRVLYDPFADRWILVAASDAFLPTSSVLIAVSQTADPTGIWYRYSLDGDRDNQIWVDYPSVGFNKAWIVIQFNAFTFSGDLAGTVVFIDEKEELYSGSPRGAFRFTSSGLGDTHVPTVTYDPSVNEIYLLTVWNSNLAGDGVLRLFTISDAGGQPSISQGILISVRAPWAHEPFGGVDFAPQLGNSSKIQLNDSRIQNALYRNGSIWAAHTIFLPPGDFPTRSAVQWWELSPSGAVRQRGRIEDPLGKLFYAYPSIAVNGANDALLGYSRFSSVEYPSAYYSFRAGGDPANRLRAEVLLKAGEAPYYRTDEASSNRWGDYSATVVDPLNDSDLWTIQEYSSAAVPFQSRWGTWWGRVVPLEFPTALTAGILGDEATLSWHAPAGDRPVDGYNIYQTRPGSLRKLNSGLIRETQFSAGGLTAGVEACFVVRAVVSGGRESADSNTACATLPLPVKPPADLTARLEEDGRVELAWNPPAEGVPVDGYNVYQTRVGALRKVNASLVTETRFTIVGPQAGPPPHCFVVRSLAGITESANSGEACAPPAEGGLQLPGDCNQDGSLDISDGVCLLGYLFLGEPQLLPCGGRTSFDPGNIILLDSNLDGGIDLSDAVRVLGFLFLGQDPPGLGIRCTPMVGCPDHLALCPP